ncbi:MAG: class IV adenylate cyclase [Chitinophagaceae bacterium]
MPLLNIEIKARCADTGFMRRYLLDHGAEFKGTDHQTDTYFNVAKGRLKLREGNIENNLIYYERTNQAGPKSSHFDLVPIPEAEKLKAVLSKSLGVKVIVQKKREIYFITNVKFHIDEVPGLGNFAEIEASNKYADISKEQLQQQCDFYLAELKIKEEDLISLSYSDMLLEK